MEDDAHFKHLSLGPSQNLRPKGRGTKASGGVRHGDSYKGIITDIDAFIYI